MSTEPDKTVAKPRLTRTNLLLLSTIVYLVFNLCTSDDMCFAGTGGVILTLLGVAILDSLLVRLFPRKRILPHIRIAIAVLLAYGVSTLFVLSSEDVFRKVFGSPMPAGVNNLEQSYYISGPMDQILIFRFQADSQTLQKLISDFGFEEDSKSIQDWKDMYSDSDTTFWQYVFGGLFPDKHPWNPLPPPANGTVYTGGDEICPHIILLWDPDTGTVYVQYTYG